VANTADSGELLHHINLARGFRGGERQTEILIRGLARYISQQRLVTRRGTPLHSRLEGVSGIDVVPVNGRRDAFLATSGASLIHAHETRAAQVACLRACVSATPYVITRRIDNRPKTDFLTRFMYRRAARVAVLSRAIADRLHENEPRTVTERIPSVVSDFQFDTAWVNSYRSSLEGKFLVGHIAALDHSHKGQLTLVEAARRIATSHAEIQFVVVGHGRDHQRIRDAACGLGNVSFTGWVENVGDYLAAFDMFVLPSLREGFGSILVDAMQFGLPIVASSVGGIPDIIEHRKNGILVAPGNDRELADAIVHLYTDAGMRDAMATAARRRSKDYRPEQMVERYWQLYQEILPALAHQGS